MIWKYREPDFAGRGTGYVTRSYTEADTFEDACEYFDLDPTIFSVQKLVVEVEEQEFVAVYQKLHVLEAEIYRLDNELFEKTELRDEIKIIATAKERADGQRVFSTP